MGATISHGLSMTTPDNTAYENRPSHWNATHAFTLNATGSEISGAFSNANGLSFGLSAGAITASHNALTTAALSNHSHGNPTLNLTNLSGTTASNSAGFTLSLSAGAGGAGDGVNILAAGTQTANTTGTVLFDNANGISFGMNNSSVITASHNALTTAMASNRGSDFVQATAAFAGTSASGTIASNGISVSIGPYITTGALSNHSHGVSFTSGSTVFQTLSFTNSNGISFNSGTQGIFGSHNALTTARASNDAVGLNTALTAGPLAWTVNSAGISLNAGSAAGTTSGFTGGASISGSFTHNTAGLAISLAHPSWITTAAQSDHSHGNPTLNLTNLSGTTASNSTGFTLSLSAAAPGGGGAINVSAGTTSGNVQTLEFGNANGISFQLNGSTVTASHNGLTSQSNQQITAGNGGFTFQTLSFSNLNGISFGTSAGSAITASHNAITTGALSDHSHGNPTLALTNLTGTTASASAGFTLSLSAAAPGGGATITQRLQWPPGNLTAVAAMGNGSFSINRVQAYQNMSATQLDVPFYVSIASSATANTWGLQLTVFGAVYTKNGNTLSSLSSGSTAWSTSAASNSAGGTQIFPAAIRPLSIPMNVNMSVGEYYVGFGISTNTSSAGTATTALGNTWSVFGGPIYSSALGQVGDFTATTNTSTGLFGGQGVYSAAISTVPPTVSLSAINQTGSYYARGNMGLIFRNI